MNNSAPNDTERLIRLEEELAFAENRLESLNEALLGQQRQIDKLEARLENAEAQLRAALAALRDVVENRGSADEKPPHYL